MKPTNWHKMSPKEKKRVGEELAASERGRYIISQALVYAIDALQAVPAEYREESNIQDMEILYTTIYGQFAPDSGTLVELPTNSLEEREAA